MTKQSRYHILGEVGRGQFGTVLCGSDRTTGELFALKRLEHLRFPTHQFLKELAILARLNHPNIVGFHGLEYSRSGRYLVMDYCQGGTLRTLMQSKVSLSLFQTLALIQDVLKGLEQVHQHRIVHCDLKPENILLNLTDWGWQAKIADFGIAHFMGNPETRSPSAGDTGSPAYMAPERFYGEYSPESDLYSVGVLLFEMVLGQRPFSGMPADVMKAHLNQPLRLPRTIPTLLKVIIRKALQKLPQHRYSSAQQMVLALEPVMASLAQVHLPERVQAVPPSTPGLSKRDGISPDLSVTSAPSSISLPTPFVAIQPLQLHPLQDWLPDQETIIGLWHRPQGCFIATHCGTPVAGADPVTLWRYAPPSMERMGTIPGSHGAPLHWPLFQQRLDIDPSGRWFIWLDDSAMPARVQIFKVSDLSLHRSMVQTLPTEQVWFTSPRHFLIAHTPTPHPHQPERRIQTLCYGNRRGQRYWHYAFEGVIGALVPCRSGLHQLFAVTDAADLAGLWLHLAPLKLSRMPFPFLADWICAAHWGYITGDRTGSFTILNRRGRVMKTGRLPLEPETTLTAVALADPNQLWVATQTNGCSALSQLDLTPFLPESLLRL